MKKIYKIEGIDCAVCAEKIADAIRAIEGVVSADISFFTEKLTIEVAEDRLDEVMKKAKKIVHKLEPDAEILI